MPAKEYRYTSRDDTIRQEIRMTTSDKKAIAHIQERYARSKKLRSSISLVLSMGIAALQDELNLGRFRIHPRLTRD